MKTDNIGVLDTVTFLATCVKLSRKDGVVMGFTDYVEDLVVDGVVYVAKTGYSATTITSSSGLAVDNLELEGVLNSEAITEIDIVGGKYNFATIQIFQVNYQNPTTGKNILRTGFLGEISRGDSVFKAEIRGLAQMADRNIGQLYSEKCRANLGDDRCKINMANYTHNVTVTSVNTDGSFTVNLGVNKPAGYFDNGVLTCTSGVNNGVSMEVSQHIKNAGGNDLIIPFLNLPSVIVKGDTMVIKAGCTKLFSVCSGTFGNYLNFRGEHNIPGTDKIYTYPGHN